MNLRDICHKSTGFIGTKEWAGRRAADWLLASGPNGCSGSYRGRFQNDVRIRKTGALATADNFSRGRKLLPAAEVSFRFELYSAVKSRAPMRTRVRKNSQP